MTTPDNAYIMQAAAEKAIKDLQQQATDAKEAADVAKAAAERAETGAKRQRKLTILIGVLLIVVVAIGSWSFLGFRQQAVNSCGVGNDRAAATVTIMNRLVFLLEGPHPDAKTIAAASAYDKFVADHNKQRDCSRVYTLFPLP